MWLRLTFIAHRDFEGAAAWRALVANNGEIRVCGPDLVSNTSEVGPVTSGRTLAHRWGETRPKQTKEGKGGEAHQSSTWILDMVRTTVERKRADVVAAAVVSCE